MLSMSQPYTKKSMIECRERKHLTQYTSVEDSREACQNIEKAIKNQKSIVKSETT